LIKISLELPILKEFFENLILGEMLNRVICVCFIVFLSISIHAQTIINTEDLLQDADQPFVAQMELAGKFKAGNQDKLESYTAFLTGKRNNHRLWRFIIAHDFEEKEKKVRVNDWSSQLRYNHFVKKHSFYGFVQAQNVRILHLEGRYLVGLGYRHRLWENNTNYIDLGSGMFFEHEVYPTLETSKWRYSINAFSKQKLSERLDFSCVAYFQLHTQNLSDFRLYLSPRITYNIDQIRLFINIQNRFHALPYGNNKKNDIKSQIGLVIPMFNTQIQ
jgi:hypothetical protein